MRWQEGGEATYGFAGKERDDDLGLIYYGARYLDATTGRWISPDPGFETLVEPDLVRLPEATSTYAYVLGDPVNLIDPDGRELVTALLVVGAAFGIFIALGLGIYALVKYKQIKKSDALAAQRRGQEAIARANADRAAAEAFLENMVEEAGVWHGPLPPPPPEVDLDEEGSVAEADGGDAVDDADDNLPPEGVPETANEQHHRHQKVGEHGQRLQPARLSRRRPAAARSGGGAARRPAGERSEGQGPRTHPAVRR